MEAQEERLLRPEQVSELVGIKPRTISERVKANEFPAPVWLSKTCKVWKLSDVRRWISDRTQSPEKPTTNRPRPQRIAA